MLTLDETRWNFKAIQMASALAIFPLEIDMKTGKIKRRSSQFRSFLWRAFSLLAISHCFYVIDRLVQVMMVEPEKYFRWDHAVLHIAFAPSYPLLYYIGFCMFRKNPAECVMIFNQLFLERENPVKKMVDEEQEQNPQQQQDLDKEIQSRKKSGSGSGSDSGVHIRPRPRPLLTWPPKYSLDEILAKTFPFVTAGTTSFIILLLAVDPTRPQLLYSFLPAEYQNVYSFFGLLGFEAIFVIAMCVFDYFSIVCQLLFFAKCQQEFKRMNLQLRNLKEKFQSRPTLNQNRNRDIRKEIWILRQILKEMKELVLFIELFNRCFPPCIFAFKLVCLSLSILCYFFTIRHAEDFPLLGFFTGYMATALTVVYAILYEKSFSIPEKMERLKHEFLLSAHKSTHVNPTVDSESTGSNAEKMKNFQAEVQREIGGIRVVGVKVGSFNTLERESTPKFVDFVLQNVVNLLVTFSR